MKKILAIVFALWACWMMPVCAQSFSIINTDASGYPRVMVQIEVPGGEAAMQADFKIFEKGKEVPFNFLRNEDNGSDGSMAICFLIEASGHTYGKAVGLFKNAVTKNIEAMNDGDLVNVCYFGKANSDGRSLNTVSAEFTTDKKIITGELKSKVVARRDTNRIADVFKSIYECLDFINSKDNLPANKALIVISAAINNSRSPIKAEDCIDKANEYGIPVYTITFKTSNRYAADNFVRISDKTGGKSISAKTQEEIDEAISEFVSNVNESAAIPINSYTLDFLTEQDDEVNYFQISYSGEQLDGSFSIPEGSQSFWSKYLVWILIGISLFVVIAVIIVWFFIIKKKKSGKEDERLKAMEERNRQLQQQLSLSKEEKTEVTPEEKAKFDLKKTQIGGGGGTPMLMVSAGSFSKNFPLNKPQMSIGRNAGNDIVIPETTVSGNHATLINENSNWVLIDNKSTNGTFVNGTKITRQRVLPTDTIKLGAAFIKIQF